METGRLSWIQRNLHLAATTDSVRTAPSLPFDGVIPCQSGATIHGCDSGESRPLSPVRNGAGRWPAPFKTNYNTPGVPSRIHEGLKISKTPIRARFVRRRANLPSDERDRPG